MLIKKSGNTYRRASWWESFKFWNKQNEEKLYVVGICLVGAGLIAFTLFIII